MTEPVESRPWRPEDGPAPKVWSWPAGDRPALRVWSCGAWRYAAVMARHDYPDGRVIYQVAVDLDGSTTVVPRAYEWPQPALRLAHPSQSEPSASGPPTLARGRARSIDSAGA
ncbi:hypothetical protein BGK67_34830 (plasmid) [Streptomyces subrutilus]|uniref:Uncharacterized protein n=1 Tax=Streptomyces subrutilus TaxID=36818 RepID=A0A1E5NXU0_9ACTN|nr:hypothetical protein BGK67_34830 [Streptomyces subrutilus]